MDESEFRNSAQRVLQHLEAWVEAAQPRLPVSQRAVLQAIGELEQTHGQVTSRHVQEHLKLSGPQLKIHLHALEAAGLLIMERPGPDQPFNLEIISAGRRLLDIYSRRNGEAVPDSYRHSLTSDEKALLGQELSDNAGQDQRNVLEELGCLLYTALRDPEQNWPQMSLPDFVSLLQYCALQTSRWPWPLGQAPAMNFSEKTNAATGEEEPASIAEKVSELPALLISLAEPPSPLPSQPGAVSAEALTLPPEAGPPTGSQTSERGQPAPRRRRAAGKPILGFTPLSRSGPGSEQTKQPAGLASNFGRLAPLEEKSLPVSCVPPKPGDPDGEPLLADPEHARRDLETSEGNVPLNGNEFPGAWQEPVAGHTTETAPAASSSGLTSSPIPTEAPEPLPNTPAASESQLEPESALADAGAENLASAAASLTKEPETIHTLSSPEDDPKQYSVRELLTIKNFLEISSPDGDEKRQEETPPEPVLSSPLEAVSTPYFMRAENKEMPAAWPAEAAVVTESPSLFSRSQAVRQSLDQHHRPYDGPELNAAEQEMEDRLLAMVYHDYREQPWWERTRNFCRQWDQMRLRQLGFLGTYFVQGGRLWEHPEWPDFNQARRQTDACGARYQDWLKAQFLRLAGQVSREVPPGELHGPAAQQAWQKLYSPAAVSG